jgi:hypothetical protein
MAWTPTAAHTFATNDALTAANSNAWISAPITNLNTAVGSLTAWTPVLTAATTNPTNYTGTGWYVQVGNFVSAWINIATGASWTAGSGAYTVSLPVTADVTYGQQMIGFGWLNAGASINTLCNVQQMSSTTLRVVYQSTLVTGVTAIANNLPAAWPAGNGNAMRLSIDYVAG